jgi:hypothetical protein
MVSFSRASSAFFDRPLLVDGLPDLPEHVAWSTGAPFRCDDHAHALAVHQRQNGAYINERLIISVWA